MGRIQKIQKFQTVRPRRILHLFTIPLVLCFLLTGCTTTYRSVKPDLDTVTLLTAQQDIPETEILDVRIQTFDPGALPRNKDAARGLSDEIRQAEAYYIAVQIRKALEQTGHWGAVRVVPDGAEGDEVQVYGKIIRSNGEELILEVNARDALGNLWFKNKKFKGSVTERMYKDSQKNKLDVFRNVYIRIANELSLHRRRMTPEEAKKIRQTAQMRFAAELAPEVFTDYLKTNNRTGRRQLDRLPPDGDELFERTLKIRERNYMLVDTLDEHYESLYKDMADMYSEWRKSRLTEMNIIREVDRRKNKKVMLGGGIIVGTVLLNAILNGNDSGSSVTTSSTIAATIATATLLIEAEKIREEAEINKAAIEELGASFTDDVEPTVIKVEGEVIKLTGSVEAKYQQWREVMKELYRVETDGPREMDPFTIDG